MDDVKKQADDLLKRIDAEEKRKQIREIEAQSLNPDFWKDNINASGKMKEMAQLKKEIEQADALVALIANGEADKASKLIKDMEFYLYLSGFYDKNNAIISIHAGQGGVDAMDWAEMLHRMYARFFERKGWGNEIIDITKGEEAGIKSVSILVEGDYAYGYLKKEQGVHRLVRLSPFNADKLRHTSFALVEILPQIEKVEGLDLKDDDLEWEFYRASSHGGQNVQKVSTAVRLKHKPSGIIVSCQSERYQAQNRENALKLLKAKLWAKQQEEVKVEEQKIKGVYKAASWGNQIRSYVLHPYRLVKDLRSGYETGNNEAVLEGEIDKFIEAELKI